MKYKGPRCQNPADGAAHAHEAEFLLRILHVREGNGVRHGLIVGT
jgi:hypothetical protein